MFKKINPKTLNLTITIVIAVILFCIDIVLSVSVISISTNNPINQSITQVKRINNAYANISSNDIKYTGSEVEVMWDLKNPYYFYENTPISALVHIDSIDGGRNYSPIFEQYTYPQTVGKMTILDVYKGDIKPGEQLAYSRLGGIVTFEEYWNALSEAQRDKITHLNNGKKPVSKKYIKEKFFDDIDIEVGKNYVVFLIPQSSKDGKHQEYLINGMQYGLREAKGTSSEVMVLDNQTKKWENLSSIVRLK